MNRTLLAVVVLPLLFAAGAADATAQVRVHPTGVNVNSQGATTAFLTFGGLRGQIPVEAVWCGDLIPATPEVGLKCNPATIFGSLPVRFDQSQLSAAAFTDIMSIPPSVSRRAYQAAERGDQSSFFYVRRFVSTSGGRDEYVAVTCRLAGGGARTPLSLTDVRVTFTIDTPVLFVAPGVMVPPAIASVTFNGSGRLRGRWEIVRPGEEPPDDDDLLTEASLPLERRSLQRRYSEVGRFNEFLSPTGRFTLKGPDPRRLPTDAEGIYLLLLRIEASDDKEGDSDLAAAGAGTGVVHSGAVAGFPMPVLRYVVGGRSTDGNVPQAGAELQLLTPPASSHVTAADTVTFAWRDVPQAALYQLEITTMGSGKLLSAIVPSGIASYRAPPWLAERATDGGVRWRVAAFDAAGGGIGTTAWRVLLIDKP